MFVGDIEDDCYISFKDNNSKNLSIDNLIKLSRRESKVKIAFDENEWKFIPGYENRYVANRDGEIKSLITGRMIENNHALKFEQTYPSVKLTDFSGKRNSYYIHRLVYLTFVGEIDKNMVIDHIDRNKFNNKLENLRMVTLSENAKNRSFTKFSRASQEPLDANFVNLANKYKNLDLSNYEINIFGQCRNNQGLILNPGRKKSYEAVNLKSKDGKLTTIYIHQLVATVFIENPNNHLFVNHKDEKRDNNHFENLEWMTQKQNITYSMGKKVRKYTKDDILVKEYESANEAAREIDKMGRPGIRLVCDGKQKTAYGFKWQWV